MLRLSLVGLGMTLLCSALVLGSCSGDPNLSSTPELTQPSALARLTVRVGLEGRAASGLGPQGIPFELDGTPAVQTVNVRVYDASGQVVVFDAQGVYQGTRAETGPKDRANLLILGAENPGIELQLPVGRYTFQATGLARADDQTTLAFGRLDGQSVMVGSQVLTLPLRTLLGGAEALSLTSALPLKTLAADQPLELLLSVGSPLVDGQRYTVPLSDFDVTYTLNTGAGRLVNESPLGVQLMTDAQPSASELVLTARVGGLSLGKTGVRPVTLETRFNRPFLGGASLQVDLQQPLLQVLNVGSQGAPAGTLWSQTRSYLIGEADDDRGVGGVQVYAGPALIGSTQPGEYNRPGVARITFAQNPQGETTSVWQMPWTTGQPGPVTLSVIARDTSGNEAREVLPLNVLAAGVPGQPPVQAPLPVVVQTVQPSSGPQTGKTAFTIRGFNLQGASVTFGNVPAEHLTITDVAVPQGDILQISGTTPRADALGVVPVTVTTPEGSVPAGMFKYVSPGACSGKAKANC